MADDLLISNLFSVKDKIALITGGGTGIGKMIAKAFVKNGAIVYIASRNKANLDKVAKELTEMGPGKCLSIEADLNSKVACEKLANDFKNLGNDKLDILVNNSGIGFRETLTEYSEEQWDAIYNLNVKCVFYLTIACLSLLEKASKKPVDPSRVINIGSILGTAPNFILLFLVQSLGFSSIPYNTSKSALHSVSKNLAVHLTPRGINVNSLVPGMVPVTERSESSNELALSEVPQGRLGGELDMAGTALFLASRAASWVTGTEIIVDGGCLLRYKLTDLS
ncbi:hypothetical protein C2G38_1955659 [Gigaspora rosea]|uniref:Uncharacterized protein n=1 Tax=Gigaspora rosea TaxID=44941 RepID=A0A397VTQ1_9GLOM|nr:hypothetical protein C2G38_1955659 [Gigaspora rosea]